MSIPKILHYCWFGKNAISDDARRNQISWEKIVPILRFMNGMKIILI